MDQNPDQKQSSKLTLETKHPVSLKLKDTLKHYFVKDRILSNNNSIEVPDKNLIMADILRSLNDIKLEGYPG